MPDAQAPDIFTPSLLARRVAVTAASIIASGAGVAAALLYGDHGLDPVLSALLMLVITGLVGGLSVWWWLFRPMWSAMAPDSPVTLFPKLIQEMSAPVYFKDRNLKYIGCNDAFEKLTGYRRADLVGKQVTDVAPSEEVTRHLMVDSELLAGGSSRIYEAMVIHADGSLREIVFYKSVFRDRRGEIAGIVGAMFDITQRRRLEEQLRYTSNHDELTGLSNRRHFIERLDQSVAAAEATAGGVAVIYIDLDDFKLVNDTLGHASGDKVLVEVAARLGTIIRENDTAARIGGDEFTVLLGEVTDAATVDSVRQRIEDALCKDYQLCGTQKRVGFSIGSARYPQDARTGEALLRAADAAMYRHKSLTRPVRATDWRRRAANQT